MRRRNFIAFGVATIVSPVIALAQGKTLPRVGVLWHAGSAEEEAIYLAALLEGLNGLGYIDGKTIALEHRFPNEMPERFASFAAELVALKPDVLIAVTRPAAVAAQRLTTTIPIVFLVVPDPVGTKLVQSLARPGGNVTGLTQIAVELTPKRLSLFKEQFPRASRITLLLNANDPFGMQRYMDEFKPAALALGLTFEPVEVRSLDDFQQAFDKMVELRLEGVFLPADGLFYQGREQLAKLALARRLPLVVHSREMLEAGALMSYGPDMRAIFRRAGAYVDKILKGEKPSHLPVELPTKFELLANLKTARALGREFSPSVLAQVSDMIE